LVLHDLALLAQPGRRLMGGAVQLLRTSLLPSFLCLTIFLKAFQVPPFPLL
jgi:hypothetical protein